MQKLRRYGLVGTLVAGLFCLIPPLALMFGIASLGWLSGYAERVALPLLVLSIAAMFYAQRQS